jgi:hypothetical protein
MAFLSGDATHTDIMGDESNPVAWEPIANREIESETRSITPIRQSSQRKAKNCKKGKPCGGSCISNAKSCRIGLSADQKALAVKAKKTIKSGGGGDGAPAPEKQKVDSGEKDRKALADAIQGEYSDEGIELFKRLAGDPPYWEDVMAVNNYTSSEYDPINAHLRWGKEIGKDQDLTIKRTDEALKAMPKFNGTVYRGTKLSQDLIDGYKVGETITERAYVSTSRSKDQAFAGNARFVIQSKSGVDVSASSNYEKEQEVLIPRNSKFKVLRKRKQKGDTIIYLEEVS